MAHSLVDCVKIVPSTEDPRSHFGGSKRLFDTLRSVVGEDKVDHRAELLGAWHYLVPFVSLIILVAIVGCVFLYLAYSLGS